MVHTDPIIVDLTIDGDKVETTPTHFFYTQEYGWVQAGALWQGAHVRKADGSYGVVEATKTVERSQQMYDLTVDTAHTFFVGDKQFLVHNIKCSQKQLDGAVAAQQHVGTTQIGDPTEAAIKTKNGWEELHSGYGQTRDPQQLTQEVMELADEIGHPFPASSKDNGVKGRFYASHAELKPAVVAPNVPVGQSNVGGMCDSCQKFYSKLAAYRGKVQVVASPDSINIFYPNGTTVVQPHLPGF